jgi:hypothetical protein
MKPETTELLRKIIEACDTQKDIAVELPATVQLQSHRVALPKMLATQLGLESIYFKISKSKQNPMHGGVLTVFGSLRPILSGSFTNRRKTAVAEKLVVNYTTLVAPTLAEVKEALPLSLMGVSIKHATNISTTELESLDAIQQRDGSYIILK